MLVAMDPTTAPTSLSTFTLTPTERFIWKLLATASVGVSAYHGYKRHNGSIPWALGWGLLGGIFPVITPTIAIAQGLGTVKK